MAQKSIDSLVYEIKAGNSASFEVLYDRYSPALYGVVSKVIRDEEQAADILQDAMVSIWKKIDQFDPDKGTIFTWMLNIARNRAIDVLRKNQKVQKSSIHNDSGDVNIPNEKSDSLRIEHIGIKDLLDDISDEQALMIEYLYFKGYTQQEVSDELNMPLGTVKSRSRAALKALRKIVLQLIFWI